jgi:hypothetical protein
MGSGHLIGKDHIGSVNVYQAMHISWRHWKGEKFAKALNGKYLKNTMVGVELLKVVVQLLTSVLF